MNDPAAKQKPAEISPQQRNKNRRNLLLLTLVFVAPIALGYLLYFSNAVDPSSGVNKGRLIMPPAQLSALKLMDLQGNLINESDIPQKWWLLYVVPDECDARCENALYQIRQVRRALGKNTSRVERLAVFNENNMQLAQQISAQHEGLYLYQTSTANLDQGLKQTNSKEIKPSQANRIYIVDPNGNIMMSYPTYRDKQENILKSRNILDDLNKMLKVSQIG